MSFISLVPTVFTFMLFTIADIRAELIDKNSDEFEKAFAKFFVYLIALCCGFNALVVINGIWNLNLL